MTSAQPPADQAEQQQRPARRPRALDVVEYTHTDPILGREHTARGVVVSVGGDGAPTVVRPLAGHSVHVDPDAVRVLAAGDFD